MKYLIYFILFSIAFFACRETLQVPKPRTYPRVIFPEKSYRNFDGGYCDFTFDYPRYANVIRDSLFFGEKPPDDCWLDIEFPEFNGNIHCTYHSILLKSDLEELLLDEFKMSDKHHVKADYINEVPINKGNGTTGMIFEIEGPAASNLLFFLTDNQKHFLRGALYFKTKARPDSIAPILNFIREDINQMIVSLEWN